MLLTLQKGSLVSNIHIDHMYKIYRLYTIVLTISDKCCITMFNISRYRMLYYNILGALCL
jgi:hypothetical protein